MLTEAAEGRGSDGKREIDRVEVTTVAIPNATSFYFHSRKFIELS